MSYWTDECELSRLDRTGAIYRILSVDQFGYEIDVMGYKV